MSPFLLFISLATCFISFHSQVGGATSIGINYGLLGDNLPSPDRCVSLLKSRNVNRVRIFDPNQDVLTALANAGGMEVVLGTLNSDLEQLASNPSYAAQWVSAHVVPFRARLKFRYITAGNEVIPGPLAHLVLDAMKNLDSALKSAQITDVPVSTAISFASIGKSFPPSAGEFSDESKPYVAPVVEFLAANGYPLLANVYPYFAYKSDPTNIDREYALGNSAAGGGGKRVVDGNLEYQGLFDAMVDTMYAAAEKVKGEAVKVVVSETGWPSAGADVATVDNARAYVNNVAAKARSGGGTPRRQGSEIETYLFALFNEDLKAQGEEQNFGLYRPDLTEVYKVDLN
ncbi:unnamed protein product [Linum tenue]|uniref:glucan endo-1,3-beta-D-glucosidase n=1 Tax=Linum tenue TaxID=586396 RepID=A0AAV0J458_9ROSI|nr:unnamed protein product [Linum tenue]